MTAQVMVFRCGGFAAATKNIFFMFFLPCWGGFRRFPRRRPEKAKLQGRGEEAWRPALHGQVRKSCYLWTSWARR